MGKPPPDSNSTATEQNGQKSARSNRDAKGRFGKGGKGGPGRPKGSGRADLVNALIDFMSEPITTRGGESGDKTRMDLLFSSTYATAIDRRDRNTVACKNLIYQYCLGKPPERVEMSGPEGGPIETESNLDVMTTAAMRKRLAELRARAQSELASGESPPPADKP